jgi:hypothetical protein
MCDAFAARRNRSGAAFVLRFFLFSVRLFQKPGIQHLHCSPYSGIAAFIWH